MKKQLITLLFFISASLLAQQTEEELENLMMSRINNYRIDQGLEPVEPNEILNAAAFDQAAYIIEKNKITHVQDQDKKKLVADRVLYYEGLFGDIAENATQISRGSKELLELNGSKITITSDEQVTQAILISWLKDEKFSKLNVVDPNFSQIGVSILSMDEVNFTIVCVFGTAPYERENTVKYSLENYKIEPYHELKCKKFNDAFPSLSQLFSDVITIEEGKIYLEYHNKAIFEEILEGSGSALHVDVIQKKQFDCEDGNRIFPGTIADGFLMKPMKKGRFLAQNLHDSINEVKVFYDEVPTFFNTAKDEMNLVVVKDGIHCVTVPYNNQAITNKKEFIVEYLTAGYSPENTFVWEDSLTFNYHDYKNWRKNWTLDSSILTQSNFSIENLKIHTQVSPTTKGNPTAEVMWDSLHARLQGTIYQLDLKELDSSAKIEYLMAESKSDPELNNLLESLNKVEVHVKGKGKLNADMPISSKLKLYQFYLDNNNISPALFLQAKLMEDVRDGKIAPTDLSQADPSQQKSTLKVINNQIILETLKARHRYGGNPIHIAFFELYLINKAEVEVAFNYHLSLLKHWSKSLGNIDDFDSWDKNFSRLSIAEIPEKKYARAKLNYYLIAADYYYEKGNFQERKKSFSELMKWVQQADLSEQEQLDLAKTLCYHDQYSNAINLLKNSDNLENSADLLLYYLQIAPYRTDIVKESTWLDLVKTVQKNYPKEFCALFSKEKMGFQKLKTVELKKLYCANCN